MRTDWKTASRSEVSRRWEEISQIALRGLHFTYSDERTPLPHTVRCSGFVPKRKGHNPRYALIAMLGLTRNAMSRRAGADLIDRLRGRLTLSVPRSALTPGDHGLGLWAIAADATAADGLRPYFSPLGALAQLQVHGERCDSVELAWLLLGACHALQVRFSPAATTEELAERALDALIALHNPATGLFWRHRRPGAFKAVSRRVPCFANQIYPLMALAVAARVLHSGKATALTFDLARRLCRTQGPLGQWWWLYDAHSGQVVEEYPVFSVHQDGMAPMALLEAQETTGVDYTEFIARGLSWIDGHNELSTPMIATPGNGLILRDIHICGVGRVRRITRSLRHLAGLHKRPISAEGSRRFTVNRECRPYHLGWALYAAALWNSMDRPARGDQKSASAVFDAPSFSQQQEPLHAFDGTESKGIF